MSLYSGNKFDVFLVHQRLHGPYSHYYFALILCNILTPQLLWIQRVRTNVAALFVMSLIINTGMWLERFVIVVISLTRDFMPSAWGRYQPTFWDWSTFVGTLGLRSEEHTSELQSPDTISYAVFCLKKKKARRDRVVSLEYSYGE